MSSSRHSSFSRSTGPQQWRSPTKPAPANVSLVFAEPTHVSSPPGAAAMRLPKQHLQSQDDDISVRSANPSSILRRASQFSLRSSTSECHIPTTTKANQTVNEDPNSGSVEFPTANVEIHTKAKAELDQSGTRNSSVQPNQSLGSSRSGWFSSFKRTAVALDASSSDESHMNNNSISVVNDVEVVSPFKPTSDDIVPSNLKDNFQDTTLQGQQSNEQVLSCQIVEHSSLESKVGSAPVLPNSSDTGQVPPVYGKRQRTKSNLSILNPSAPRFMLTMPLLGRPKVPLGKVVGIGPSAAVDVEIETNAHGSAQGGVGEERLNGQPGENVQPNGSANRNTMISNDTVTTPWWSYIGWTGTAVLASSPVESNISTPSTLQSPSSPNSLPATSLPSEQASLESANQAISSSVNQPSFSSWYSPWGWYTAGQHAAAQDGEPVSSLSSAGKSAAELVKEEALARSADGLSIVPSAFSNADQNLVPGENRSSWLSVFGSASTRARSVQQNQEVMESIGVGKTEGTIPSTEGRASQENAVSLNEAVVPLSIPRPLDKGPASWKETVIEASKPLVIKSRDLKSEVTRLTKSSKEKRPNLVLPTFEDTFTTPPRSMALPKEPSTFRRTLRYLSGFVSTEDEKRRNGKEPQVSGQNLPRIWSVLGEDPNHGLKGAKRVVVVGIHGWFPGSLIRQVIGEPTGTSQKFANMMGSAVEEYFHQHGTELEKLTKIVLEGEGTIEQRVNLLLQEYQKHEEWVEDLQNADAILFATHSQGSIVTTQLIDRLITEGHIRTHKTSLLDSVLSRSPQKVGVLALCGVHIGPLLYLNTSSIVNPYIQYLESAAARELFEFQDSESTVSKKYVHALTNVIDHGVKFTYIASMNDQVVPIYSGSFTTISHPLILRALYIDGDAYYASDFLSNLLVLLFKIRNAGIDDGGLIIHLSEATAGSLSGVGHSSAYEEPASYTLAVRFLFETSGVLGNQPRLNVEPFTARAARNDYEIPWALRDLIAHPEAEALFSREFSELRDGFGEWHPRTSILRDIRRKLEPIRRLPVSVSKL